MGQLHEYIDTWNGHHTFIYVTVLIFVLWIFYKRDYKINVLIAILVAYFIISYLNHKSITTADTLEDIFKKKKKSIKPEATETFEQENVINFLFSIQDLYKYNPQQYEHMIDNINSFYKLYKITFIEHDRAHINYTLMEQMKRDALNAFQAIIFKLPNDIRVLRKVEKANVMLDEIMTKHLDQISFIVDNYDYKFGKNVNTKIINYGVKPFNEYSDIFQPFSYEIH